MLESTVDVAFTDSSLSEHASSKEEAWDIAIVKEYDALGMPIFDYYKLTPQGRRIYNILVSLGYNFTFDKEKDSNAKYSLLPLIPFCKVYLDWYVPSK
ncbi:hypothetical protein, partial [Klebsiella pneumoniae]|uniref:hypothetical protein n=1 Tax=Klebsiella pneumoniae TaxID=573 RepID=UPI001C3C8A78